MITFPGTSTTLWTVGYEWWISVCELGTSNFVNEGNNPPNLWKYSSLPSSGRPIDLGKV